MMLDGLTSQCAWNLPSCHSDGRTDRKEAFFRTFCFFFLAYFVGFFSFLLIMCIDMVDDDMMFTPLGIYV